ncbi:MAG: hypothetical protein ACLUNZ_09005 [Evtepia sp.]
MPQGADRQPGEDGRQPPPLPHDRHRPDPHRGAENGAKIAKKAHKENISLKEAAVALGLFTPEAFDAAFHPEEMA